MYNLYTNSSIYLTSRTSLLSFHNHQSSIYANGRCQPCSPSFSCSCCSCCCNCCSSFSTNSVPICNTSISTTVPINPSQYGLRQSTLIQWSPSRRRSILASGFERRCYETPISDLGWNRSSFPEDSLLCRAKQKRTSKVEQRFARKGELGFGRRRVLEERYEIVRRSRVRDWEDAESILSLLSEDVGEAAHQDIGEKKRFGRESSSRKEKLLNKRDDNVALQRSQGRRRNGRESAPARPVVRDSRVKMESVPSRPVVRDSRVKMESVPARPVERDSKVEMESVGVTRRYNEKEDHSRRRDERREAVKDESRRLKKSVSSYSSYCTCSEDGYVTDDVDLELKDEQGLADTAHNSSGKRVGVVINEGRSEGSRSHRAEKNNQLENNKRSNVNNSAEWDWRKKSEKKLSEDFADDIKVRNDSVSLVDQLSSSMAYAGDSAKASSSRMQSKASVLDVNSIEKSRTQVSQTDAMASSSSRYRYENANEFSGHGKERISGSSNQFSGREENMSSCDHCQTCGQITVDNERRQSHLERLAKFSSNQDLNSGLKSSAELRESELRRVKKEEISNLRARSVHKSNLEHHQVNQLADSDQNTNAGLIYGEDVSSSDQQTYFSQLNVNDESITSIDALSEARFSKRHEEENSILLQASIEVVNKQLHHQINLMSSNPMQSRISDTGENCVDIIITSSTPQDTRTNGSGESSGSIVLYQQAQAQQNEAGVSAIQQNESRRRVKGDSSTSRQDYEQRLQYEQIHMREKIKTVEHHRVERHELIDEKIKQSQLRYETQMPIGEASFQKGEVTSSQPPVASSFGVRVEEFSEGDNGRSSPLVRMPSHIATNRKSHHVEPASKFTSHDSGNRLRQPSHASSSRIRVEEIEEEDERDSLIRRSASCPTVEVDPAGKYTRQDSGWSSQQSSHPPSSHTGDGENWEGAYERTLNMKLLPPPPQRVERNPDDTESDPGLTREDFGGSSGSEPCMYMSPAVMTPPPLQSEVDGTWPYEEPSDPIASADVMGSAERMDHMSHQVVGEFVEKARNEASTSSSQVKGKSSKRETVHEGKEYKQKEENQSGRQSSMLKKTVLSHHSSGSRYYDEEPIDEMWGVTDLSLIETKDKESSDQEGGSTPGNDSVKRSGKSLWNVLGDIVRFRWSNHSESYRGPKKSGVSLGDSASSEAWFDPELTTHESNSRRGTPSRLEDPSSAGHPLVISAPEYDSLHLAGFRSSSTSGGIVSRQSNVDSIGDERTSEATTSIDVSLTPLRRLRRSRRRSGVVHEMAEDEDKVSGSGQEEHAEQRPEGESVSEENDAEMRRRKLMRNKEVVRERFNDQDEDYRWESNQRSPQLPPVQPLERLHERSGGQEEHFEQRPGLRSERVSVSEGDDAEMRRRKLLRNEQVVRERFDDWEEAYRRESKQRKIDEIFMREALEEANKAAALWEVPVGAVLVRDGRIIARGHNLVEELRDSTAHAEMICIREASNALRTWRLAEVTLYVTLEPCAMCAGAILQARVGTLVYGAPNKLLGADGSWIRLFPGSNGGDDGTLEQAGPVHPFHRNMTIRRGILQEECADAMQQFFRLRRKKTDQSGQHSHIKISLHPSKLLQKMQHMFHIFFCL